MHLHMSSFAVENGCAGCQMRCGGGTVPGYEEVEMCIVETGAVGVIAIASQFLIVAAVLI
jgi:hypothetical protein